jgi:cation diffusion facilitator CzcD-associated flavoprotein CzcO
MSGYRYCVIGAGAAGLAATAVLREQGFDVVCLEKTQRVGGHWHTDYESLHLITSRDLTSFDGYPMPAHYPVYPSRDQMRSYLEAFAADRGLAEVIRFGTEVTGTPCRRARRDG